ncbi:hypothetical protein EF888_03450 [Silicimonas algicola]|nr:hypothetical protein EF888_03450 [Silicimonas algicola]
MPTRPRSTPTSRAVTVPRPEFKLSAASPYPRREERATRAHAVAAHARRNGPHLFKGKCWVIDGDTIVIDSVHIRLAGIDAPELDHPWGLKAKWAMVALCKGQIVTAKVSGELSHDRVVAVCTLPDGRDLAEELVKQGLALDWAAFSGGRYACHEPDGVRKRLWRAAGRQKADARRLH